MNECLSGLLMLLLLHSSEEVQETLTSPEMLLLGDFDGIEVISHNHSCNQEDDVTSTEMDVARIHEALGSARSTHKPGVEVIYILSLRTA